MKRGPKPRLVTDEFLRKVEHLAARGLSQQQVCHALGFSETWWYDAKQKNSDISESFKRGQAKGLALGLKRNLRTGFEWKHRCSVLFSQKSRSRSMVRCEVCQCSADQRGQNDRYTTAGGVEV